MKRNPKRVLVGMSGGVDSSVAACLLHEQGYEVIGITIKTYRYEDVGGNVGNDSSCCSLDGINDARRVCNALGIPHYVVDWSERFKEEVIDYFVEDYLAGNTPNPCVKCNRLIKWGEMLRKADMLGAEWIATGHYANIRKDPATERYVLSRDSDNIKDQSYALWGLKQEHLSRTLFPLTGYTKDRSRADAERFGLTIAKKPESYEICFIPDNDYKRFMRDMVPNLEERAGKGDIVMEGEVIGSHQGYHGFTVGQRKGLGISHPEPLYVLDVLADSNTVLVGTEEHLLSKELVAHSINLIKYAEIDGTKTFTVKIRYKDEGAPADCTMLPDGTLHVKFHEDRKAITPGQSIVLYEGNDVIGGGIIDRINQQEIDA
ncbi:MAG: tRNA 2-thiouridine(34) synthase MnmA [Ignavibacteriae bacterium]|jgi:tRNA-specific 2-thiouridylase|nr:tRNA 2-thiouridine(34) synthase MnmA [Ignavibacteriota bacterium]